MAETKPRHPREAIAERNVEAILDGAERLLDRREQPSISAVAAEAGLSRPTVYAHFPDRARLVEAIVERAVARSMAAIEAAEPDRGEPVEALQRMVGAAWENLARNQDTARAAAAELSGDAMRRAHESARALIARLIQRGRRQGAFRTDVPADWLVTSTLALMHAAAESVRSGELPARRAGDVVTRTVTDLAVGP